MGGGRETAGAAQAEILRGQRARQFGAVRGPRGGVRGPAGTFRAGGPGVEAGGRIAPEVVRNILGRMGGRRGREARAAHRRPGGVLAGGRGGPERRR